MPKVHHVKARKDYPEHGIQKGDMHYTWSLKTGPRSSRTYRQIAKPRPSQLTTSEFLASLYDWQDSLEAAPDMESISGLAEEIRSIGETEREKFDNMPENFQQGDTGQMLEQRADACEAAADELEEIHSRWENEFDDAGEEDDEEGDDADAEAERRQEWDDNHLEEAKAVSVDV